MDERNTTDDAHRVEHLETELATTRQQLADAETAIARVERLHRVDGLLRDAETIDLEAARLLTEIAISEMDEPDIELAVKELRDARPYLFRQAPRRGRSMCASTDEPDAKTHAVTHAAAEAHASGHRSDLLRYLRLKRR